MKKYADDGFIFAGCLSIVIGTYYVCPVATWFVAGLFLIIIGVLLGIFKG